MQWKLKQPVPQPAPLADYIVDLDPPKPGGLTDYTTPWISGSIHVIEHTTGQLSAYASISAHGLARGPSTDLARIQSDALTTYRDILADTVARLDAVIAETCPDCNGAGRGGPNTTDGAPEDDCAGCSATGRKEVTP